MNLATNKLTKTLASGVLAASVLAGVASAPAQALGEGGKIIWADLTDDFIGEVDLDDTNDTFDVTFNPFVGDDVTIEFTDGDFVTWLGKAPPVFSFDMPETTIEFKWKGVDGDLVTYETTNDGEFDFTSALLPTAGIAGLRYIVPTGTEFEIDRDNWTPGQAGEFDLCLDTCEDFPFWEKDVDGDGVFETKWSALNVFDFQQQGPEFGDYGVESTKVTPEPASLLSLLGVGALGLGLKRKKDQA